MALGDGDIETKLQKLRTIFGVCKEIASLIDRAKMVKDNQGRLPEYANIRIQADQKAEYYAMYDTLETNLKTKVAAL